MQRGFFVFVLHGANLFAERPSEIFDLHRRGRQRTRYFWDALRSVTRIGRSSFSGLFLVEIWCDIHGKSCAFVSSTLFFSHQRHSA